MADAVELRFRRALEGLIPSAAAVVAAVSGGGDSMALLHLLVRCSRPLRLAVTVAHLDHAMRRGSRADRRFVEDRAAELGLPCVSERRAVGDLRRSDESPEEAARRVRRGFLLEVARRVGAASIATGHTLDDQAETVLMRLARGAGTTALGGMGRAGPGPFVRPLLDFEGAALREWLAGHGLAFRDDPSNRNMRFDRNRVRRRVLPVLVEQLNPRAARHLVKAAESWREDAVYLDQLAERLAERTTVRRGGRVSLDAAELRGAEPVLARRVVRLALIAAGADPRRVGSRHVASVLALAAEHAAGEIHLPGRLRARRVGRRIAVGGDGP